MSWSLIFTTIPRQPALGRSQRGDCPAVLVPSVALLGLCGGLVAIQQHTSIPGSLFPGELEVRANRHSSFRLGVTATVRRKRRRKRKKREEFREHQSLEGLFPGMSTSVYKQFGEWMWSTSGPAEVNKRKRMATGGLVCWKVTSLSKPFSLNHINLEEQRIPHSWGNIWRWNVQYTALQRRSNACYTTMNFYLQISVWNLKLPVWT